MKFTSHRADPIPMQLAPMIDILFLLLAFFVTSWQFTQSETELNISVPTAQEGADPKRSRGEIIINVSPEGLIRIEGAEVTLEQMQAKLSSIAKLYENQPVRIRGDGKVPYQKIVEVIDTCQKSGIWNISFATQRPTGQE